MSLNILKLCVGAESLDDLQFWSKQRLADMAANQEEIQLYHTTRMVHEAPSDLGKSEAGLPVHLRSELAELGLL